MTSPKRARETGFFGVNRTLRDELPRRLTGSAEVIALKAGATKKAAQYWQQGHCLPSLAHALAVAQSEPHLRRLILEILNAESGGPDDQAER